VPLVTTKRWRNRRWSTDLGPRGSRITAWGMPLALRLHDDHTIQAEGDLDGDDDALVGPGRVGRHYDLPGGHRLIWREVGPGDVAHPLRPFEETPGELDHLAEHGVRLSVLRLAAVPDRPIWRHCLTYPPGTRFVYQPPLTQAEIDEGAMRPRAVVGSYAVLDAKGCKIGHILRPCAISADRTKRLWGVIQIQDGVSEVAFRRDKLEALGQGAVVFGLDTFGYTSIGATGQGRSRDYMFAEGPHSPASDGQAEVVHLYTEVGYSRPVTLGLYSDNGGTPEGGSLLRDTAEGTLPDFDGWADLDLDTPVSVTGGQDYWIGARWSNGAAQLRYDSVSGYSEYYKSSPYSAGQLDNPYPTEATQVSNREYSAYVSYTPSGAGVVAPQFMHLARMRRA